MSQKQEINRLSEESQKLLDDMNQTENFQFCEMHFRKSGSFIAVAGEI